ncbi:hypothetical protein KY285_036667 [Solanum tuberosum]|nr:hypothetical protein KY285_036667 [Solanum tuberosum]
MEKLTKFRDDIKEKVAEDKKEGYKPKPNVILWIEDVCELENEWETMQEIIAVAKTLTCKCCPKCNLRSEVSTQAQNIRDQLCGLKEVGENFGSNLVVENYQVKKVEFIPVPSIQGQQAATRNLHKILQLLEDDKKRITLVFCISKYIVVEEEEQVKMSFMKFEIDRFSGRNNFNIWKIQMMVLLPREGSIHAIDEKYPDKTSDFNKEKIEGYAISVIQFSLAPSILCEVGTSTEETTKELWKRLEGLYQDRSVTTRMLLQRHLHTFKMDSGTLLQDHLDAFNKLVMMHFEGDKGDETSGLFNAECWGCHKKGHFERDFPMSKSKEKASTSIVEQVHDSDDDYVLTTSCNSGVYDNKWVLDSGCTLRMTFRRDWFSSNETSGGTVLMGNNATCKIVGIGSVRVRCHDGTVRTITEVRHVPDLKKNLISPVSRDVTLDESSILDHRKVFVELSRNENNKQVELLMELTKKKDQKTQADESKDADLEELVVNEPYIIAKGKDKRQIQKPKHLIEQANLITHAFVAAKEEIKDLESSSYIEASSCKDVA